MNASKKSNNVIIIAERWLESGTTQFDFFQTNSLVLLHRRDSHTQTSDSCMKTTQISISNWHSPYKRARFEIQIVINSLRQTFLCGCFFCRGYWGFPMICVFMCCTVFSA